MHHLYSLALKYSKKSIYIPLLAAFLFILPLCGQEANNTSLQHTLYNIEDGLSNQLTHCTLQDSRGFMWIMTNYGFSRFDGKTFVNYSSSDNLGLSFGGIVDVCEDAHGNLWLSEITGNATVSNKRLLVFNPDTEKIKLYQGSSAENYYSMDSAPDNRILLGTNDGKLFLYEEQKEDLVYAFADERTITEIIATDNYYWLNSGEKLSLINRKGELIGEWSSSHHFELLGNKGENIYVRDVSIATTGEAKRRIMLYEVEGATPQVASVNKLNEEIDIEVKMNWKYFPEIEKFTVFNAQEGLFLLEEDGSDVYSIDSLIKDNTFTDVFHTYFCEKENLWVSSISGLHRIQITSSKFTSYLNELNDKRYSMRGIVVAGDSLYCATYSGNIIYDLKKKEIVKTLPNSDIGFGLSGIKGSDGCIYLGGMGDALQRICENGEQEEFFYHASNNPKADETIPHDYWVIVEDSNNKIWLGTNEGLSFFNEEKGILEQFKKYNQFSQLSKSLVFDIIETETAYWIASERGLFKMDLDKGITSWFHSGEPTPDSKYIPADIIYDIHQDADGILWLTTYGSGLIRFNPQDGSYKQITVEQGLAHNVTNDILEDEFDNLWISTNNGLVCLNRKTGNLVTFDKSDGIHMDEFNKRSSAKLEDGRLVFGGLDGFVAFHPKDFLKEEVKEKRSRLCITQLLIEDTIKNAIDTKVPIVLADTKTNITINLHLLEFSANKPPVYEWKWKNEKEFRQLPNFQFHLSEAPYGESTVVFRAKSAKGTPALNELELSFSTPSLFSLTQVIGGIIALLGLYFFFFRTKKKDSDKKDEKPTQVIIIEEKETREKKIKEEEENTEKESSKSPPIILSPTDKKWLDDLREAIEKSANIGQFSVEDMANEMNLSSRQLNRKVKQLAGLTPNQFLRNIKLEKAKTLLENGSVATVAEASFAVGFEKPDYFSRLFQERYGVRPVSYFDKKKGE